MSRELPFTSELWKKLGEYLDRYRVVGQNLKVKPLGKVSYHGKIPDIVIVDASERPQLIIETKRKYEKGFEDIYDPLGKAPIAQALCYAALALEYHNLDRTPLFATANSDVIIVFRGVGGELRELVDIEKCKERHAATEDWTRALKPGAYSKLLYEYLLARLEKPLSDDTIKRLFSEYLAKWITRAPITPAQLYSVLVDQLRYDIERLHDEHVEDTVKNKVLGDAKYFAELHELALKQGYPMGILSPGLLLLCPDEDRISIEKVCRPLAERISEMLLKVKQEVRDAKELYSLFKNIADKYVRELVDYCTELANKSEPPPTMCNKMVREVISFRNLSRMMTYTLAAKILAYKVLELNYNIRKLNSLDVKKIGSTDEIVYILNSLFEEVPRELEKRLSIKDFTPIFKTNLYDKLVFKGLDSVTRINALIETADAIKDSLNYLPGVIGYVYEGFIPPRERHQLGQFYTPPAVARLIATWVIRSGSDIVLDGGCGSGTFLIEAYKRLLFLKFNKVYGESYPVCKDEVNEHQEVLDNLYGVDINAFAAQLTSLHLMFMEPRCPFSKLNIEVKDFFSLAPTKHEELFDAVIGNPPYTRWVEIPEDTKRLIKIRVGDLMSRYNLVADVKRGREPGIYVYWIVHATKNLLKRGGRLGMIVSNMWLQTDYGVDFGKFLLDNFKVKALIDVSYRLFDALISTVIVLAEKEPDKNARETNEVLLVRIPPIDSRLGDEAIRRILDEALKCVENSITSSYEFDKTTLERCRQSYGIWYGFVKQAEIPRDRKWISLFFERVEDVVKKLETHQLMVRIGEWFKPSRGNSIWSIWALDHGRRPDLGTKDFFYFSRDKIADWDSKVEGFRDAIEKYLVPAITASRYIRTLEFTEEDWRRIRDSGRREKGREKYPSAQILVLHERREALPQQIQEYIRWGETECRTKIRRTRGGGRICSEAEACRAREEAREETREPYFYGWYDLGGYIPTPLMAIRQSGYRPQFFYAKIPVVTYDAIIAFIPKVKIVAESMIIDPSEYHKQYPYLSLPIRSEVLDEIELKALLAYLNSTFAWLWTEQSARRTGGGALCLEVNVVESMPILNVKKVGRSHVEELAKLFDELESTARSAISTGSSTTEEGEEGEKGEEEEGKKLKMFKELREVFKKIDRKIAEVLGISVDVDELWSYAWEMMERRIKGAGRKVVPGAEGVEVAVLPEKKKRREKRKSKKKGSQGKVIPLDRWSVQKSETAGGRKG